MKLDIQGKELDLDCVQSHKDVIDFIESLEPQETISLDKFKITTNFDELYGEKYKVFDFLTPREKSAINLLLNIMDAKNQLANKLNGTSGSMLEQLMELLGEKPKELKPVNIEDWTNYNKLAYLYYIVKSYIDFSIYTRVGWDMYMAYEPNGKIWTLKDIRDVFTQASIN